MEDPALDDGDWAYRRVPNSGLPYFQHKETGQIVVVRPSDAEAKAKREKSGAGVDAKGEVMLMEGEMCWVEVGARDAEEKFIKAKKTGTNKGKHVCKTEEGKVCAT